MNSPGRILLSLVWVTGAAVVLGLAGCENPFVPKHKVLVDAISAPGASKPTGKSYRLIAKKSVVSQAQVQVQVVKACVDAALVSLGLFEAPANAAPEMFIEVGYGTETSGRLDPAARETFVQLSARDNPDQVLDRGIGTGAGAELWDVRVAVLGLAGRIESAMPLLCAVAANYIGTDTRMETKIEIPQNSPMVSSVRETAIKSLESRATASASSAPAASPPPAPPATSAPVGR